MTTYFYQLGNDYNKTPFSGPESTQAVWCGNHTIQGVAQNGTIGGSVPAANDIIEIPLFEIPAGVRPNAIKWAFDAAIANASSTAVFALRRKEVSVVPQSGILPSANQSGISTGQVNTTFVNEQGQTRNVGFILANGAASAGTAGQGALPGISGAGTAVSPTVTGVNNGSATISPIGLEGTTYVPRGQSSQGAQQRTVLQDSYYLSLYITLGTAGSSAAPLTAANIFVGIEGEFVGNL